MKLRFFPALLPLAAIFPWVFGALGTLFTFIQLFLRKPSVKKYRLPMTLAAIVSLLIAAGSLYYYRRDTLSLEKQTRALMEGEYPKFTYFKDSPTPKPEPEMPTEALQPLWTQTPERQSLSAPVLAEGLYLQGTFENTLDAYDAKTGKPLWSLEKSAPIYSTPVVRNGVLYIGEGLHTTLASTLTAVSLQEPKVLWHRMFEGHLETAPRISDDGKLLYVTAGGSGLWCVETATGKPVWHQARGHADMLPYLDPERVIVGFQENDEKKVTTLLAFNPTSGRELWRTELPGQPWGEIGASGNQLFFSTSSGQLGPHTSRDQGWAHALDLRTGKLLWTHALSSFVILQPLLSEKDQLAVFTLKTGELIALKMADGSVAWQSRMISETQMAAVPIPFTSNFLTLSAQGQIEFWSVARGEKFVETVFRGQSVSRPTFTPERTLLLSAPDLLGVYRLREDLLK